MLADFLVASGLSVLILGPALGPGFSLSYDMVFVPRLPFTARLLGLDGSIPKAVPSDAVVAALSRIVPAELLQKLILVAILVAGGMGAARLVRRYGRVAAAAATVLYLWNPYVGSRLLLGQWAILVSFAALPWLVLTASKLGGGDRRAAAGTVLLLALSAVSPSGGVLAAGTALAVAGFAHGPVSRRVRSTCFVGGAAVLVNLPWLLPALLRPGGVPSDPAAAGAFAARADTSLGTVLSVLTLGGTWNSQTTPSGRDGILAGVVLVLLVTVAGLGITLRCRDAAPDGMWWGLVTAGGVALLVAVAAALPPLRAVTGWVVADVPGGGLFRDGTRYLAPFVLLMSLGFGQGLAALRRWSPTRELAAATAVLGLLAPVAVLSGLAWGGFGQLGTARYPAEWEQARDVVSKEAVGSTVLVLPWGSYRQFPWNDRRTMYDPADRWLPARTVGDDRLRVGGVTIAGSDRLAVALTPLVESGAPLAQGLTEHGVGWVLLERTSPGGDRYPASRFAGMTLRLTGPELQLWQVPGADARVSLIPGAGGVVVADVGVCLLLLGAVWQLVPVSLPPRRRVAR